jgi:PKD repeat protein
MKNFLPFLFAIMITACKKTEIITITVQQPTAKFSVMVPDPYNNYQPQGMTTYIDSNFYFQNFSDTGASITYRWDFGDGATSTDKNPKHSYAKRGTYKVSLIVANDNKAFDTAQQTVSVILGQQHISFGDGVNVAPVAIEETASNEFVLLGSMDYGTGGYRLFQLDSLLNQKSMKTFPASYRLTSMKATGDGNYIFTGSTQSNDKGNELIKMRADGTQLWNKVLSTDDSYTYAVQTPDGGYAVIGSRPVTVGYGTNYNTVVFKTDNNGNTQWQKLLDQEGMINTRDAVVEQDGIVVAGTKRGTCTECDSILVIKLDNTGNIVWKNTVLGGMNNFVWWDTRIAKLKNGNYAVTNGYTRGIFFFSPSGEFLDRKLATNQVAGVVGTNDGNLVALQTEWGNGFRINISKFTLDGAQQWYAYPDGKQKTPGGYSCCSSSQPIAIQLLRNGGTITIGYRVDNNSNNYGIHTAILLLQLDEAGKPK